MIDCSKIPRLPGIYKLINIVNNKIYIGSSINYINKETSFGGYFWKTNK